MSSKPFPIPIHSAPSSGIVDCQSGEPYALMVLGDSMQPEFNEGEIIVVEPEGLAKSGSFVVAYAHDEYIFRQLMRENEHWCLKPLNPIYPDIPLESINAVKGVVLMKKRPGKRHERTFYTA